MAGVPNSQFAYHVGMLFAAFLLAISSISHPVAAQSDGDALAPIAEQSRKRIEQGRVQLQNSDYTGAVTTLSGVIRNEKVPAEWLAIAFFYRGIANRSRAEPEAAVADFVNALWLGTLPTPIVAQAHYHRALAYAAIRKFNEAMADFDEAQRLAPEEQRIREARESVRAYMNDETTGSIAGVPLSPEDAVRNALGNGAALAPTTYANRPRSVVPSVPQDQPVRQDTAATSSAPASAPATGYRIQLGALGTRALAESSWVSLREQHGDLLGNMAPSYENITRGGKTVTRLRAGYVSSALAARSLCAQLIKRGQECIVVTR